MTVTDEVLFASQKQIQTKRPRKLENYVQCKKPEAASPLQLNQSLLQFMDDSYNSFQSTTPCLVKKKLRVHKIDWNGGHSGIPSLDSNFRQID